MAETAALATELGTLTELAWEGKGSRLEYRGVVMRKKGRRKSMPWFVVGGIVAVCLVISLPALLGAASMLCPACAIVVGVGVALLVTLIVVLGWRHRSTRSRTPGQTHR